MEKLSFDNFYATAFYAGLHQSNTVFFSRPSISLKTCLTNGKHTGRGGPSLPT